MLGPIPNNKVESFGLRTDCEALKAQMKSWLEGCVASHPECKALPSISDYMPTRVLDIGSSDEKKHYMTMSHCWGKNKFVELTAANFTRFITEGVTWKDAPWASQDDIYSNKNFLEGIEITRELGIQYICIDSLYIFQHDEKDWNIEAKLMHKVYRNSYCNLGAVDLEDSHRGLFGDRNCDVLLSRYVPRKRMLSPRLLQFGRGQIFWVCATISACKALPAGLLLPLDTKAAVDRH
ncbi:tol protein [Colletotrichum graminicola M1.001]|uniref:Tol protein n=1 Tax=Colletotrichum graminicola (strain M1.001 / M2 / FGSC 10212) TaxID=645133 RepID=E3R0U0_COLGM|nr:tol protein [Colletotrichum graminicola M1.001]EFQ36728.1 tol protein [Colletotrichum graminicola M1.001]